MQEIGSASGTQGARGSVLASIKVTSTQSKEGYNFLNTLFTGRRYHTIPHTRTSSKNLHPLLVSTVITLVGPEGLFYIKS